MLSALAERAIGVSLYQDDSREPGSSGGLLITGAGSRAVWSRQWYERRDDANLADADSAGEVVGAALRPPPSRT
jgi:hypothetical protein